MAESAAQRRWASAWTATGHVVIAACQGGGDRARRRPSLRLPRRCPRYLQGAVGSRATPCPWGTESASKAAPELGPVTACRAVGAAPHLDPKFAITVRPSASTTPPSCPSLSSS